MSRGLWVLRIKPRDSLWKRKRLRCKTVTLFLLLNYNLDCFVLQRLDCSFRRVFVKTIFSTFMAVFSLNNNPFMGRKTTVSFSRRVLHDLILKRRSLVMQMSRGNGHFACLEDVKVCSSPNSECKDLLRISSSLRSLVRNCKNITTGSLEEEFLFLETQMVSSTHFVSRRAFSEDLYLKWDWNFLQESLESTEWPE